MKKLGLIAVFVLASAGALDAQSYYQDARNPDILHHNERRERCRHGAERYHQGNIGFRGVEHFINKNVQIHIFDHPRDLSRKAKNHKG